MKKNIILGIKGFIMGIANIIPGVSSGTLAITLGVYEDMIESISTFFTKFKKNIKFLTPILIGAVIAIILASRVIEISLDKYTLQTILFFAGLIIGGIPLLYKKVRRKVKLSNVLTFATTFILVIGLTYLNANNEVIFINMQLLDYIKLFFVGVVAAATMIIPGISGSFMLMVMGYYQPILGLINDLTSFQNITQGILIAFPLGLGVLVGVVAVAKLIEYLFKKYEVQTYYGIIGFVIASLIGIFSNITNSDITFSSMFIGLILFISGTTIAYKLGSK